MNNENNKFGSLNQLNNNQQSMYNQTSNNQQINNISNNEFNQTNNIEKTKKKKYWLIPLIIFLIGILSMVISFTLTLTIEKENNLTYILRIIYFLSMLLIVPSVIVAIILSNKQNNIENNNLINNLILDNNVCLDEKLIIAYIGNNYNKIISKKFSFTAFFLSWMYTLYRKMYIPSIIGMIIIIISGFLPSTVYYGLIFVFAIVLGVNFNKWYIVYLKKQIEKIKINNQNVSENELINICRQKGGTNIWMSIIIYIIFVIVSNTLNPQLTRTNNYVNNLNIKNNNHYTIVKYNSYFDD